MWLSRFRNLVRGPRRPRPPAAKLRRTRLLLETLEERCLPSNYSAASVSDLINDINAANAAGGSNTITLAVNTTFDLTAVNNTTNGANGLPIIAVNDNLTISGQGGDIIQRDYYAPAFRLFDVANGGALTLTALTLQGGLAFGSGGSAEGGAIYNQGNLVLNGVSVLGNMAWGAVGDASQNNGYDAAGGGIWSSGTLTLQSGTLIESNEALGGAGAPDTKGVGGNAFGGGLYIAGGTANLTDTTVNGNSAAGGQGAKSGTFPIIYSSGPGGDGYGGGLYAGKGTTVTLCGDTVESNGAGGGTGSKSGLGYGGGIYAKNATQLYLDAFTLANTINNTDSSGTKGKTANIDGSYVLQPC